MADVIGQQRDVPGSEAQQTASEMVGGMGKFLLGSYFLLVTICFIALLVYAWPPGPKGNPAVPMLGSIDAHLLLLVVAAGGVGSSVHAATSFADFTGNQQLKTSWVWWLLLRHPIGILLALIVYLLLRGGVLQPVNGEVGEAINPYGIAAIAALTGMFSKQATDKLGEIFDTIFRTNPGRIPRADPLVVVKPQITGCEPLQVAMGAANRQLRLLGANFQDGCSVTIDSKPRDSKWIGAGELMMTLADEDVARAGRLTIVVANPPPGGGTSDRFHVNVQ
jgi:hypothetical protein